MEKELANKQEHLDILNANAMAITLGERSRTQAIRETIEEMSEKGIPAFIDASGREWSAEAYVNMDIRNTVKNAANAAQFASIEELGQDIVLVSSHAGARELCYPFQGKFYSLSGKSGTIRDAHGKEYTFEPWSSTSYGEAAGLLGINCGHSIRGVSDGMFINREKQYDEKENSKEYEKVVKQRELERKVRKQKTTRNALKAAGDDEGVREYDRKIRESNAKLDAYCKENGLTNRRDRTEVYGYSDTSRKKVREEFVEIMSSAKGGNDSTSYEKLLTNSSSTDIMKIEKDVSMREQSVLKQFNKFQSTSLNETEKLARVNPHFGEKPEWNQNCQRCVVAYEMIERGYDVTAKPYSHTDSIKDNAFVPWKIDKPYVLDSGFRIINNKSSFDTEAIKHFNEWGEGSRAVIRVKWKANKGGEHVFTAKFQNNQVIYVDPQSNEVRNITDTLSSCDDDTPIWIMRVDNRDFSEFVVDAVQNYGG